MINLKTARALRLTIPQSLLVRADEIIHPCALTSAYRPIIIDFAIKQRLPTMFAIKADVEAGGLLSYAPSLSDTFRRAAQYVDKVLKGANPGDLPIEQPNRFELVINLKTAKALGLTIPQSVLERADQVTE